MNLIVELDTVRNRTDWLDFDALVRRQRAACPRVTVTEEQLETLRLGVSEEAVCGRDDGAAVDPTAVAVTLATVFAIGFILCLVIYCCFHKRRAKQARPAGQIAAPHHGSTSTISGSQMCTVATAEPAIVQGYAMGLPVA